mgnify:CR=1 FL=1
MKKLRVETKFSYNIIIQNNSINNLADYIKNIDDLNTVDSIDGYLIGGASAKPAAFQYIINSQN